MKKSFSLIEITVTIAIMLIMSATAIVGFGQVREGENVKSDYLQFISDLKNIKLQTNLGKVINPQDAVDMQTTVQTIQVTIGNSNYLVNSIPRSFKYGSVIRKVQNDTTANNSYVIKFFPNNFSGPTPACQNYVFKSPSNSPSSNCSIFADSLSDVSIVIGKNSATSGYSVHLAGTAFFIQEIKDYGKTTI